MSHHTVYVVIVVAIALIVGVSIFTHVDTTTRLYTAATRSLVGGANASETQGALANLSAFKGKVKDDERSLFYGYVKDALHEGTAWCRRAQNEANFWALVLVGALLVFMVVYHFGMRGGKR